MSTYLIDHVSVLPHYQRSIRFDVDVGREDVLKSYVMTTSGVATLAELAQFLHAGNQAAFTWTGPYGTGKSALAVYLAALADRDSKIRKLAQQMLPNNSTGDFVRSMFGTQGKRWKVVPITGDRRNIYELINEGLKKAGFTKKGAIPKTVEGLIQRVEEASLSEAFKGARPLIILDEMGKCLESALLGDGDIYDFQQVAEGFARSSAKPVLIGILHQSFEYYASRMSNEIRQEWSKIQGRFVDLTLKTTTDEVVGLAAQAIQADYESPKSEAVATAVFDSLKALRPNLDTRVAIDLKGCWPLHPISVMLVSALSRKAFTQAQRSLFGFLSSNDPAGFRDFLKHTAFSREVSFNPTHVFDYVATNFDQVLASSAAEGKRWVMIKEGLARVESKFGQTHCEVFKTIAVMELLREPQSILPSNDALSVLFDDFVDIHEVTRDLSSLSVVVYRRYQDCWALFAGSDFDLEAALRDELQGLVLSQRDFANALDLAPVVAKSYYSEYGALRWLDRGLIDAELARAGKFSSQSDGALATLILVIAASESDLLAFSADARLQEYSDGSAMGAILGIPESETTCRHAVSAHQILAECVALENILRNRLELDSDEVARRLVRERLEAARSGLANHLIALTGQVVWRASWNEKLCSKVGEKLSSFASRVARDRFPKCPPINNELLNREVVSTAAAKARKELMIRMLDGENLERLGLIGWPAEAGLYESVIKNTSHHVQRAGVWLFECSSERADEFGALWRMTDDFLRSSEAISASRLYAFWSSTPFGLKAGLAPLLLWLYLLARRHEAVFYIDGTFQPALAPINADELLRKPDQFSLRLLTIAEDEKALLERLAEKFAKYNGQLIPTDVLNVARAVVREFLSLPTWTKRTSLASVDARKARTEVLKASDPNQLLFVVLPNLVGTSNPDVICDLLINSLSELRSLLPEMVTGLWKDFVKALGIDEWSNSDINLLRSRADEISDSISHPGLKILLPRLRSMDFPGDYLLEQRFSLICTAAGKTDRDFYDHDIDVARQSLREWALEFRRTELLKQLTNDSKHRAALTIGLGIPDASSKVMTVDVDKGLFSGQGAADSVVSERFRGLSREQQALTLFELSRTFLGEMADE